MTLATWWRQNTPAVNYVRAELPARHLPGRVLQLEFSDMKPHPILGVKHPVFPRQKGAAVWMFSGNATRGLLMAAMQEQGTRVLMELDDNYMIRPPEIPGYVRSEWKIKADRGGNDQGDWASAEAHRQIARFVDGLIVSTPALERAYQRVNENVFVCPNCVDPDDWPEVEEYDGPTRIVYAGSHSHVVDVRDVVPALEWAASNGAEVLFLGVKPTSFHGPHKHVEWTDSVESYRQLLRADIGVCPLRPSLWADCKSDIKALEYTMAGALPIVSDTEPYRVWREMNFPVARKKSDWLKLVKWAVRNPDHARAEAKAAREYVLGQRTIQSNVHLWRSAVDG